MLNSAPGALDVEDLVIDDPTPDEVLIAVDWAGLCHSDLHEMDGTFETTPPIVLGHEASGVVEAVGAGVRGIEIGDRVVTCMSASCGSCKYCLLGRRTLCLRREELTQGRPRPRLAKPDGTPVRASTGIGAFAQKVVVHHSMVAPIPDAISGDTASILGCAVTTGMGAVIHSARVTPGSSVAVIGLGGIGMSSIQAAQLAGAETIIGIDVVPDKLESARSFGATRTIDSREEDVVDAVRALTGGGVDYCFEAVGSGPLLGQAVSMLCRGGMAVAIGMIPSHHTIPLDGSELFFLEKQLRGSFMGSNRFKTDIPHYVELNAQGRLRLDDLVTDRLPLERINEGFSRLTSGASIRTVVRMAG